jgi:CRP-like cAMP-binding protein
VQAVAVVVKMPAKRPSPEAPILSNTFYQASCLFWGCAANQSTAMTEILPPAGPLYQLAVLLLLLSTLVHDVLILRIMLFFGFFFLMLWSALGVASWPDAKQEGILSLDGVVWNAVNASLQLILAVRIWRQIKRETNRVFLSPRQQQMWNALRRVTGMSYTAASTLFEVAQWEVFHEGSFIQRHTETPEYYSIIFKGLARARSQSSENSFFLTTLDSFDFTILQPLGLDIGVHSPLEIVAVTEVILLRVHRDFFPTLAQCSSLLISLKQLLLFAFSRSLSRQNRQEVPKELLDNPPNLAPLSASEDPPITFWSILRSSFSVSTLSEAPICFVSLIMFVAFFLPPNLWLVPLSASFIYSTSLLAWLISLLYAMLGFDP